MGWTPHHVINHPTENVDKYLKPSNRVERNSSALSFVPTPFDRISWNLAKTRKLFSSNFDHRNRQTEEKTFDDYDPIDSN